MDSVNLFYLRLAVHSYHYNCNVFSTAVIYLFTCNAKEDHKNILYFQKFCLISGTFPLILVPFHFVISLKEDVLFLQVLFHFNLGIVEEKIHPFKKIPTTLI